ncbi:coiled-coil domain-containing protein 30 [Discoglossus pictus]
MDKVLVEDILNKLKEEGLSPGASAEDHLSSLWSLYEGTRSKLETANSSLEELKQQQAEEMKDVESYVAHIRSLTEERESLTTDFEKENIQLRIELEKLQFQQDSQLKEVEEMLDQEGLSEITHSSPSEQVAYLLVERATLLEKLELLEQRLETHLESLSDVKRQDELEQIHQTLEEELYQQRESMKRTKETLNKEQLSSIQNSWKKLFGIRTNADKVFADSSTFDEELDKEKKMRESVERDLDEAARRLQMAHGEIRRLTDDLLIKKKEITELEHNLQKKRQETEVLKQEITKLQGNDSIELQKAKDYNNRLDKENLALRNRVRTLDSERKKYMEQIEKNSSGSAGKPISNQQDNEVLHKRCQLEIEERECVNKELLYKLKKLQNEHDETVERNEELESILGETQNQTKDQIDYLECEIVGLQRTIKSLEEKLSKAPDHKEEGSSMDRPHIKMMPDLQQIIRHHEENVRSLENKLAEEKMQRKKFSIELENVHKHWQKEKEELRLSKSALKELQDEVKSLKSADQENVLCKQNGQKEKEKELQDKKIFELTEECKRLQLTLSEEKSSRETSAKETKELKEKIQSLENEIEAMSIKLSESKKKCELLQRQIHEGMQEKQNLWEENLQQRQEIKNLRHELQSKTEMNTRLKQEVVNGQDKMPRRLNCGDGAEEVLPKFLAGDDMIQQQNEEICQLRQDLHRVQHICSSAEKELRYERDKNLEIKKQLNLLQSENTKVNAEFNHLKQKFSSVTDTCSSLEGELDQKKQTFKLMELELLKQSQTSKVHINWQEKLEHRKNRAFEAEKQVVNLQQQLRATQHQLVLLETQTVERKHLEEEAKKSRENESKLKAHLQDEKMKRKILDQTFEDLQGQIKVLQEKEISLTKNNAALQYKLFMQESRLHALDDEQSATAKERIYCEINNQKLTEELLQVQQEKERLHMEYDNIHKQLDEYIRKYNEKHLRYKAKRSRAKEIHISEVSEQELRIKQLEMDLLLCKNQSEKNQQWISKITAENDHLNEDKRQLLQIVNDLEAVERNNKCKLISSQKRAHILDEENRQLQESILQLFNQVGALERVLKKMQALNLEDITNLISSEYVLLSDGMPQMPNGSFSPVGLFSSLGMLKAINSAKVEESAESQKPLSLSHSHNSEIGYLNVTSPELTTISPEQTQTESPCSANT